MPTTPEMSEASPSPRQASAGFFRFPFVGGNASPRRFRGRAMSGMNNLTKAIKYAQICSDFYSFIQIAESNTSHSDDIGQSVAGSSSPPSAITATFTHHLQSHERPDPSSQLQPLQSADRRLRFPRFLRRTHSASATTEAPPPYALFLRTKRVSSRVFHACRWQLCR